MQRQFTRKIGRFEKGEVRDYTAQVWAGISNSARLPLDKFTKPFVPATGSADEGEHDEARRLIPRRSDKE